ncbi:hypothetical protein OC844_006224 [Tilletia horrida]|nr:hypothetical protein OC844_006224 [Tilletia horrida]
MPRPANTSDWRQVQLQRLSSISPRPTLPLLLLPLHARLGRSGSAASMPASSSSSAVGSATGAASAIPGAAAAAGSGFGTGATTPSGQFCTTIDIWPPSTLRMELCIQNGAGTSQELPYDPVSEQLTLLVDGSRVEHRAASGTGSASASAATPTGPAPASVKLVFFADAPSTVDMPPAAPADVEDAAMVAADDAASSATGAVGDTAAIAAAATGRRMGSAVMDKQHVRDAHGWDEGLLRRSAADAATDMTGASTSHSLFSNLKSTKGDLLKANPRNVKKDRLADCKLLLHAYVFVGLPLTLCCYSMAFWSMQKRGVPFSDMWLNLLRSAPNPTNGFFDSKVSPAARAHAEIWSRDGKIYIRDVKSSNGSFINGERLSAEAQESDGFELHSEDHVEFGIDIVSEDGKVVLHHKVACRVYVAITAEDAVDPRQDVANGYIGGASSSAPRAEREEQAEDLISQRCHSLHTAAAAANEAAAAAATKAKEEAVAELAATTAQAAEQAQTVNQLQSQLRETHVSLAEHSAKMRRLKETGRRRCTAPCA